MTAYEALSWCLIHFLWQGAVIGLVTMAAFQVARRPETRYAAGCAGLACMGAAAAGTFAYLWGAGAGGVQMVARSEPARLEMLLPWVNRIWATGSAVLLLRALGGWLVARRRTRTGIAPLSVEWIERASLLVRRLGVEGRVRVFESLTVTVPMVFGWLRPVVLLPACALSGLTVGQVEALLAHELAHVRRRDYLVNLVQTALESLLFYHPAVWWVSGRVRRERELCCDEIAVEICGDRILYSKALLRMEETRVAIALAANGGSLTERIGRILGMSEKRTGWTPAWLLGGVLMVCMGVVWARTEQAPPPPATERASKDVKPPKSARPPKPPVPPDAPPTPPVRDGDGVSGGVSGGIAGGVIALVPSVEAVDAVAAGRTAKAQAELKTQRGRMGATEEGRKIQQETEHSKEQEIERRIRYAEKRFSKDGVNGLLTDRGRTYLKMGPPDEIESHPGTSEIWLYGGSGRVVEFDGAGRLKK